MKKIRIFIEPNKINLLSGNLTTEFLHQQVKISKDDSPNEFNYLHNVMRQKIGDKIFIFDGVNGEFKTEIIEIEKKYLTLKIIEKISEQNISSTITLAFSLLKNNRIDEIATKATELGVSAFQPLITRHSVVDKFNENRFRLNIKEACEQCERNDMAQINPLKKLDEFLIQLENSEALLIVADESNRCKKASKAFLEFSKNNPKKFSEIIIFIGPEGGFSASEFKKFYALKNLISIGLGPRILRSDTAVISTLALVQDFFYNN